MNIGGEKEKQQNNSHIKEQQRRYVVIGKQWKNRKWWTFSSLFFAADWSCGKQNEWYLSGVMWVHGSSWFVAKISPQNRSTSNPKSHNGISSGGLVNSTPRMWRLFFLITGFWGTCFYSAPRYGWESTAKAITIFFQTALWLGFRLGRSISLLAVAI